MCTPPGPEQDYLGVRTKLKQAGAPTFMRARPTHNAGRSQSREETLLTRAVIWAFVLPGSYMTRGGSALNLYHPVTAHKFRTLYLYKP